MDVHRHRTDILILGSGGAGLLAALHARQTAPDLNVAVAVKGLMGKCGCTRMVQGGYNVALAPEDSLERHFMDTVVGGKWLPRQDLAWRLCEGAIERIAELENEFGCFFDRNDDGTLHQKAFAGQSFDRTVHKGDLTGIEIINRLMEQVWALDVERLEEHRAIELIPARDGSTLAGVLLIDMRSGAYRLVQAKAVLLATGGGPTMYLYHTPSGDKSCDGLAMALRAGLGARDMEMVQFHPTGLLAGPDTRMTGTVLEEGLRGAGGWLVNGAGERFMHRYDPAGERATRDVVSRAIDTEIRAGNGTPMGGVYIQMDHLGPENVAARFPGMVKRCADSGFDLAGGRVEVVPTAHYLMGGVEFDADCSTAIPGLFAAGEDCGGVHGANRLGGNGVANSTVFGGIAGESMARWVAHAGTWADCDEAAVQRAIDRAEYPFGVTCGDLGALREKLWRTMWDDVGVVRSKAALQRGLAALDEHAEELRGTGLADGDRAFNLTWLAREDSRGAHYREDHPETGDLDATRYVRIALEDERLILDTVPVEFSIVSPGESLIDGEAGAPAVESGGL
jgi:fumarate reductase flavoprotein subunit